MTLFHGSVVLPYIATLNQYVIILLSDYDKNFEPNILVGHCDLISRFSDFVSALNWFMNKLFSHYVCV